MKNKNNFLNKPNNERKKEVKVNQISRSSCIENYFFQNRHFGRFFFAKNFPKFYLINFVKF